MKIRSIISALSIASLGIVGVSCKSTGSTASTGGQNDGAYIGNGEYDNVYEMGGGDDYDTYSYESDNSGSSYNYESNDYSSSSGSSNSNSGSTYTQASKPNYSAPSTKPASTRTHMVERGDTLFNISRRYGTSVAAIQNANGLTGDLIRIGETLSIP